MSLKKALVALLVVAMVLGTIGPVFAAEEASDAAIRLQALGIVQGDDQGNLNEDQPVTRAEAAALVVRALGLKKSAELMNGTTKFADVNADPGLQWATGAINVAVANGIINGYPNGQFGGRDHVTFEQFAKMMLYALNYGVTVEGGVWPTAVLAKADDLDLTDGITMVPGVPMTRGDVFKMIDNGLDVPTLKQTGYGDLKTYEETGETLLQKIGLDEVEGRVVEIPVVASALDDDEVVIEVVKVNGEKQNANDETYVQLEGVDVQSLFGLEVRAWVNDDDEIVFVEKKTSDNDIYTDTISELTDKDTVKLDVLDDTVTFADDAVVYVNYSKKSVTDATKDLKVGYYGRFVEKNNKIAFANLFKFDTEGVVTSVDGQKIKYFTTSDSVRTLDLTDADAVHVYNADLTASSLDKIEKDNVISWWENSDEYYIVVSTGKVEGTVEKIQSKKVTIDGKGYTFQQADNATYSFDEDDTVKRYNDQAATIKDMDEEDVVALLNLKGHIRHLRTSAKQTSGTQYGVVIGAPSYKEVTIFTRDGEEVTYPIEDNSDYGNFEGWGFYKSGSRLAYGIVSYKVNSDGEVAESEADKTDADGNVTYGKVGLKYAARVNGTVGEHVYLADVDSVDPSERNQYAGVLSKQDDEELVTLVTVDGRHDFFVDSNTMVVKAIDDNKLDPELINWDDFKDLGINDNAGEVTTNPDNATAVVFGKAGKTAKLIVFVENGFKGFAKDTYYGVVATDPYRSGGKLRVDIHVFDSEESTTTYVVSSGAEGALHKGDAVSFKLNAKGEVANVTGAKSVDASGAVDDGYITVGSDAYRIDSAAVIYQLDEDGDIDREITAGDLESKDAGTIEFVLDGKVAKALVYVPGAKAPETEASATVSAPYGFSVDSDKVNVKLITATGKTYSDYQLLVYEGSSLKAVVAFDSDVVTSAGQDFMSADLGNLVTAKEYTVKVVAKADGTVLRTATFVTY